MIGVSLFQSRDFGKGPPVDFERMFYPINRGIYILILLIIIEFFEDMRQIAKYDTFCARLP
jgi:hypothetical protein